MKKHIIFSLLIATTLLVGVGCKKHDSALTDKGVVLEAVPIPNVVLNGGSTSINVSNLASFQGNFKISMQFPDQPAPVKADIVVRKNGSNTNVKVFQAGITTFPSTYTVSAAQLVTLFGGVAIVLGDTYDIGIDMYLASGKKYEEFPITGNAGVTGYGGTGQANLPGFSDFVRYGALCTYDPTQYAGPFKSSDPVFQDSDGATIILTMIDATHFSFIYPSVLNPIPIVVTVNPANNTASVAQQLIGTAWSPAYGYPFPSPTYANPGTGVSTGSVSPCAKTVSLNMVWLTANFTLTFGGPYPLTLTKI